MAALRDEGKFLDCVLVSRGITTGQKLWNSVGELAAGNVMTDHWKPYEAFIPSNIHIHQKLKHRV